MAFQLKNIAPQKKKTTSFDIDTILKKEISFGNSFSNKKKESFYTELYVLLNAGMTLKDALLLNAEEQKKEKDKNLINALVTDLINGKNLSDSIKNQKEFSAYEYHSLRIGEQTGTLQKVAKELGVFYKRKNEQRRIIISALSYPIVVLFTAFLAILFMLQFVVPMFADIFKQNKVELPWITKKIMIASNLFQEYWWFVFLCIIAIIITKQLVKKKVWYQKHTSLILLKTPLIGEFIRKVKIAQFTQAITLLTGAKVPLLNGIQLTKKMIGYFPLEVALEKVEEDILKGKSLHQSMGTHKIFDKKMISLIKVADETNQNETIFKRLTEQYNEEIEYKSKMISATIEPFIILILGAIVATILIAMYLPMFKLSTVIN
ncbi:type II secretion system F family protein [Polaribacter glomeratus]|uniref:General secretion pathway protein GspF n=1 Tax=Polaribacter glomeratus TaxID=102 RepID=A0A2S7WFW8_9FLAO|nr:type II secretion system F family protein [Polaribacter glomeratus]PQJ76528.1 general secretion pathway protein GspF [Polaribacter glomeratus]TXD64168.1 type II secretion system F family protein [Polaribacter glomeratus]